MPKIRRALVSVSDKADVAWFARDLSDMGVEVISTGGTYKLLRDEGVKVTPVAEVTGFPEMLDGRVKTLHPMVHGGILADRSNPEHMRQLDFQKIQPIDLVVVNLYPFAKTVAKKGVTRAEAIEQIDIGGPTMVRAAAKNHAHVAVVVNPLRYKSIIQEMKEKNGEISEATCRELAMEAFAHTADYDANIHAYLSGRQKFPDTLTLSLRKVSGLRYGENPHQEAALYSEVGSAGASLSRASQVSGPALSFNNILDGESAWSTALEFEEPACIIIKHNNPCGVAVAEDLSVAYERAFHCDPVSAFGSVIAFNRVIDRKTAQALIGNFIELVLAPSYEPDALELLSSKEGLRLLEMGEIEERERTGRDLRHIFGGMLAQDYDTDPYDMATMKVVTKASPAEEQWDDLVFAMKVAKHVKSNAIVLVKDAATVGVGAGQMSRVDSAAIAVEKAGEKAAGCVAASDAFFPFPDALEKVIEAGAVAVIQPGGSKKDDEAISTCDKNKVAMVFTGRRHFRH